MKIDVKNTGDNTTSSISYTVKANNTEYTGTLPNLNPGETSQINITTDRTYPLQSVSLNTEGTQFVDSSSGLKCTPTKGLVGYWPFNQEQTTNGKAIDLSGFGNDAVLGDSPVGDGAEPATGLDGVTGESYRFRRDSDQDWINLSQSESLEGDRLSISTWVRFKDEDSDRQRIIQYTGSNGAMSHGYRLAINGGPSDDPLRFGIGDGSSNHFINTAFDGSEREWHFVTGDYNGTHLRIFVEGELKTVEPESMTISYSGVVNSDTEIGNNFNPIKGKLDEMRVYSRSLSQSEIQRLYSVRSEDWAGSGCKLTG